jgi:hypothetical protein
MLITIEINDKVNIEEIMAVGADDLLRFFLPEIHIKADRVKVSHIDPEEKEKRYNGKSYKMYVDESTHHI